MPRLQKIHDALQSLQLELFGMLPLQAIKTKQKHRKI